MEAAVISFVGLLVGATLQFLFTRHLDSKKYARELRTKAYTDYLACVSENAVQSSSRQSSEAKALFAKIADAKCRICLYGSAEVVQSFAEFERVGAAMNTPEQHQAFTHMVSLMRTDSTGKGQVKHLDLQAVLLGHSKNAP